jgi:hypothetical protein
MATVFPVLANELQLLAMTNGSAPPHAGRVDRIRIDPVAV